MEADYVIIGAGSAGSILADRLSADGKASVLVLEAGGSDRHLFIEMPLGYGKTFYNPRLNWGYHAEPDPGLAGQRDYWPRGRVLGGSSSINAMVYIRGQAADYDAWEALGNPGWGWRDVLAAFRSFEDYPGGDRALHGTGGPLHAMDPTPFIHPLCRAFLEAGVEAGLPLLADLNGPQPEGVGVYRLTIRDGRRLSAARAFLRPAMRRPNCRVLTHAQALRVTLDGRRATGVEALVKGSRVAIRARREVILAAGAVNSPQLLMLSGIGPGAALQALDLPVLHDSPAVGHHLQDHLGLNYTYRARQKTLNDVLRPWWGILASGARYVLTRTGPLSLSLNQGGGFFRTDPGQERPNMQLYFQALSTLKPAVGERPLLHPDPFPGFSIGLSSCRPTTRGRIELAAPDPLAKPRIIANAYGTGHDVAEMLDAVKFIRRLAATKALAPLIAEELRPGPDCVTDEALIDDFRRRSGTVYHPCGTCRMGPDPDEAVVDARLRVHGIAGLRIADASVFPLIPSGNTNAPAIMIGARAGDFIRAETGS